MLPVFYLNRLLITNHKCFETPCENIIFLNTYIYFKLVSNQNDYYSPIICIDNIPNNIVY